MDYDPFSICRISSAFSALRASVAAVIFLRNLAAASLLPQSTSASVISFASATTAAKECEKSDIKTIIRFMAGLAIFISLAYQATSRIHSQG
jgi:hypothetical protein